MLDIATLTGAVVGMYGFTIGGVVTDSDEMWEEFYRASLKQERSMPASLLEESMRRCLKVT